MMNTAQRMAVVAALCVGVEAQNRGSMALNSAGEGGTRASVSWFFVIYCWFCLVCSVQFIYAGLSTGLFAVLFAVLTAMGYLPEEAKEIIEGFLSDLPCFG